MRKYEITLISIKKEKLYLLPSDCICYLHCVYSMWVCMQSDVLSVSYTGALGSPFISLYTL